MRALKQSAVESGVMLKLYFLLLKTNHCTCARTYTVCCREWRSIQTKQSAAKHNHCPCEGIYTLCCREWCSVKSVESAAKQEILRMCAHLQSPVKTGVVLRLYIL
jgi:hypothetical protein